MNITQLHAIGQRAGKNGVLSLPQLRELFAYSCGYCNALRHRGFITGDAQLNDAQFGNMEVQRYAREVHNVDLAAWWHPDTEPAPMPGRRYWFARIESGAYSIGEGDKSIAETLNRNVAVTICDALNAHKAAGGAQ